jgi:hypothetical protein
LASIEEMREPALKLTKKTKLQRIDWNGLSQKARSILHLRVSPMLERTPFADVNW